jgi:hypothetical protein
MLWWSRSSKRFLIRQDLRIEGSEKPHRWQGIQSICILLLLPQGPFLYHRQHYGFHAFINVVTHKDI